MDAKRSVGKPAKGFLIISLYIIIIDLTRSEHAILPSSRNVSASQLLKSFDLIISPCFFSKEYLIPYLPQF
jgi:hypothetical protein